MKIIDMIFYHFPFFEVFTRRFYYSNFFVYYKNKVSYKKNPNKINKKESKYLSKETLKEYLHSLNTGRSPYFLLLHSDSNYLKRFNLNAIEFLDIVIDSLGNNGTLVMPFIQRQTSMNEGIYVDMDNMVSVTGLLPNLLSRIDGSIVSSFPSNGLVAHGPNANDIFIYEDFEKYLHGKNSGWGHLYKNDCKILFIGVDPSKTFTGVHIAEDIHPESWPISNWYEKITYIIKKNNKKYYKIYNVRSQNWSKFMCSQYRTNYLIKKCFMNKVIIDEIELYYVPSLKIIVNDIINSINNRKLKFFRVPKKYYK